MASVDYNTVRILASVDWNVVRLLVTIDKYSLVRLLASVAAMRYAYWRLLTNRV